MTPIAQEAAGRLLARWALDGRITLEALDQPPGAWQALEADRRVANQRAQRLGRGLVYPPPASWRNLAREWIDTHRQEWESLLLASLNGEQEPFTAGPVLP
jgi:hypothetical protein